MDEEEKKKAKAAKRKRQKYLRNRIVDLIKKGPSGEEKLKNFIEEIKSEYVYISFKDRKPLALARNAERQRKWYYASREKSSKLSGKALIHKLLSNR